MRMNLDYFLIEGPAEGGFQEPIYYYNALGKVGQSISDDMKNEGLKNLMINYSMPSNLDYITIAH